MLDQRPALIIGGFFLIYVAGAALSLPGAVILTIAAGAVFGLWLGTLIVSFASTIGASLAFLSSRFVLRDWVKARFGKRIAAIDRGVASEGALYLLTMRLIPAFPFFLVNLAMGLTSIRLPTFALVSQIGMLPATLIFVNAGTQLAAIDSTSDIASPALIGSLVLLGLFPLLAKWLVGLVKRRRVYRGYRRPRRFDRNLIVIGAGAGGLVTAYIAAAVRAKVTLVEAGTMGGDCLNTGCVPSKALIRSARLAHDLRHASEFGLAAGPPVVDFKAVMARVRSVIATIAPADSVERYTKLGVDVRLGHATIVDPWTVEIVAHDGATSRLTARSIVIAAGAEPFVPDIPGLAEAGYLTSDTMWDALGARDAVPPRLAIIGGGPIGTELAQAFARLGSAVTLVEAGPRILPNEDEDVSAFIADTLRDEGVDVRTGHEAVRCEGKALVVRSAAGEQRNSLRRDHRRGRAQGAADRLRARSARHRDRQDARRRRGAQDALPQHLRRRRCRRPLPVHPRRRAPGVVCRGQRAVRHVPHLPRRLYRHPVDDLHRPRSRACRPHDRHRHRRGRRA